MNTLTGTGTLVRLALRRDRVRLPVWIIVFAVSAAGAVAATTGLYPTAESRVTFTESVNAVPALVAFYGPIYAPTVGATSVLKLTGFGAALVGLLMILTVIRHTRAEEQSGRRELLGAAVVGRYAGLAAALAVAAMVSVALGLVTALGLVAVGLPIAGSVAFGLGWTSAGLVFGATAAVTAQLSRNSRTASGLAVAALGSAYFLRAVGDLTGPGWLSWLSPIGWVQQVRPFAGDRWWILVFPVATAVVVGLAASLLARRRDLGAGVMSERTGARRADGVLDNAWSLTWRLNRAGLGAWTAGFVVLGLVAGNLAGGVDKFLESPRTRDIIAALGGEQGLSDAFMAVEFAMAGIVVSVYAALTITHLYGEELASRVEPLLAGSLTRWRLLTAYLMFTVVATAVPLAAAGVSAGLANGIRTGHLGAEVARLTGAALAQLPAVWVVAGLAAALYGFAPRALVLIWAALAAFFLIGELGALIGASSWVLDLSPFTHLPKLPGVAVDPVPLVWLAALGAALAGVGVFGFRRRDMTS